MFSTFGRTSWLSARKKFKGGRQYTIVFKNNRLLFLLLFLLFFENFRGRTPFKGGGQKSFWGPPEAESKHHKYVGGIMSTLRDILSTLGDFQYIGRSIISHLGDIMSTLGLFSTSEGYIMSTLGILSSLENIMSTLGGYREYAV